MALTEKEEKLKNLAEMRKIIKYQLTHYKKIQDHFDEQIALLNGWIVEHDEEIAVLQEKKAVIAEQFIEAPEQLIALAKQLKEIEHKESSLKTSEEDRAKKTARLKRRIERLREKLTQAGG